MNDRIWTVESDIEIPLRVLARDWRIALCMGLQLLELEALAPRLALKTIDGGVSAYDRATGRWLRVTTELVMAKAA